VPSSRVDLNHAPAGIEASKTVQYNNYAALSDKERDGAEGGRAPSWLIGKQTKKRVDAPFQINGDPIKHDYVMPHKIPSRPIRRMGPSGNEGPTYDNGAARLNWNLQKQQLNTGPLPFKDMSHEDWKTVSARVQISPLGEVLYNVGGLEDLRPACYLEFTKADKPATLLTQYENDKRQLASFQRERTGPIELRHAITQSSPDMVNVMYGEETGARTPSKVGFSETGSYGAPQYEDSYAPSEYSRGGDPARDLRPRTAPQMRAPMSAREPRRSPGVQSVKTFEESELRYRDAGRTPMSARGSDRYERGSYRDYRSSVASSCYTESEAFRPNRQSDAGKSLRSKSVDRSSNTQRRFSDVGSPMSGIFSDPSRTVTEQALNDALRSSRSGNKKTPRRSR
jgi:hypothetical protein